MNKDLKRYAFLRFSLSGAVFTILGPSLFWLAYPIGPYPALMIAEVCTHAIRFLTFRIAIFPATKGYRVTPLRYVVSALPLTAISFASVGILRSTLDRTSLTLASSLVTLAAGFAWSRLIYRRPEDARKNR